MRTFYALIRILPFYTFNRITAEEVVKPLMSADDAAKLKDTILNLPSLGVTGIILFLVAVAVAVGVWWWWNNMSRKITHRENEKRRKRDQAANKTDNQKISDEFNQAHDNVEDLMKEDGAGSKPRPPRPKG